METEFIKISNEVGGTIGYTFDDKSKVINIRHRYRLTFTQLQDFMSALSMKQFRSDLEKDFAILISY